MWPAVRYKPRNNHFSFISITQTVLNVNNRVLWTNYPSREPGQHSYAMVSNPCSFLHRLKADVPLDEVDLSWTATKSRFNERRFQLWRPSKSSSQRISPPQAVQEHKYSEFQLIKQAFVFSQLGWQQPRLSASSHDQGSRTGTPLVPVHQIRHAQHHLSTSPVKREQVHH